MCAVSGGNTLLKLAEGVRPHLEEGRIQWASCKGRLEYRVYRVMELYHDSRSERPQDTQSLE